MAKAKDKDKDKDKSLNVTDAIAQELEKAERRIDDLEDEIEELENAPKEYNSRIGDQLDSLCVALESGRPRPQTPDQWIRCLKGIVSGDDWENGTWR